MTTNLLNRLMAQYNEEEITRIIDGYQKKRLMTFRINTLKANPNEVINELSTNGYMLKEVSWYPYAYMVLNKSEEDIKTLPLYQNGYIYLQSLSSMLPALILNPKDDDHILDMAAAPGGKTTQLAMITHNKARLTACEKNKIRAERLKYNLNKQGVTSCTVMNVDATTLDDLFSFDKILLDAPCSGSGTLTSIDDNNEMFQEERFNKITKLQFSLLDKALTLLKPGHEMVYSTCSILNEENEKIIEKIRKKHNISILPIELKIDKANLLPTSIDNSICLCPDEYYEGFFVIRIKKEK